MDSRITASLPETSQSTAEKAANPIMSSSDSLSYMYLLLRRAGNLSSKHIYMGIFHAGCECSIYFNHEGFLLLSNVCNVFHFVTSPGQDRHGHWRVLRYWEGNLVAIRP